MPSTRRWGARSKTRCARQTREYCHIEKNKSSVRSSSRRFKSIQQEYAHTTTAALSVISCTDGGPAMAVRAGNCRRGGAGPPRPLRRRRLPVSRASCVYVRSSVLPSLCLRLRVPTRECACLTRARSATTLLSRPGAAALHRCPVFH